MSKTRRMNRIFASDGRSVSLALDGFGFSEKTAGVDDAARKVPLMAEHGLDNVLVTYGQARNFAEYFTNVGLTLRVDTTTAVYDGSVPDNMPAFEYVTDALKFGADGVVIMNFPGAHNERWRRISLRPAWSAKSADWNVPLMCRHFRTDTPCNHPRVGRSGEDRNGCALLGGARCRHHQDAFLGNYRDRLIVENCTVPVLAFGGPKSDHETYFGFVQHVIACGAKGVAVGRNITHDPKPFAMVSACRSPRSRGCDRGSGHDHLQRDQ